MRGDAARRDGQVTQGLNVSENEPLMPAGGPGDGALIDIVHWRRPVYSPQVDSLIAEIAELWGGLALETFLRDQRILWMKRSDGELARAERVLIAKRDELYESAVARGWDMESVDERIKAEREAVAAAWKEGDADSAHQPRKGAAGGEAG